MCLDVSSQRVGKLEGRISKIYIQGRSCFFFERPSTGYTREIVTSHVLFSFKHYESISTVSLFLLVGLFMRVGISDDADLRFN